MYPKESYSQLGEDMVIEHYMPYKATGTYVDIGAYHPVELSNTFHFYQRGWYGICVEPNKEMVKEHLRIRGRDRCLHEGCGTGELKFIKSPEHAALSSCQNENGEVIKSRTLSEYLAIFSEQVDILSIDTEGMEMNILESNDWDKYRPTFIVVEIIDFYTQRKNMEIIKFLESKEYGLVCDNSVNAIFIEKTLFNKLFKI